MNKYYVYVLLDENNDPFYIGKGCGKIYNHHFEPKKLANDPEWLYNKYMIEKLSWKEIYTMAGVTNSILQNRLKKFGLTRPRTSWNKGLKKVDPQVEIY